MNSDLQTAIHSHPLTLPAETVADFRMKFNLLSTATGSKRQSIRSAIRTFIQNMDGVMANKIMMCSHSYNQLIQAQDVELFRLFLAKITQLGKIDHVGLYESFDHLAKLPLDTRKEMVNAITLFAPINNYIGTGIMDWMDDRKFTEDIFALYSFCNRVKTSVMPTWVIGWDMNGTTFEQKIPVPRDRTFSISVEVLLYCRQTRCTLEETIQITGTRIANKPLQLSINFSKVNGRFQIITTDDKYVVIRYLKWDGNIRSGRIGATIKLLPVEHSISEVVYRCDPSLRSVLHHKLSYKYPMTRDGAYTTLWIDSITSLRMKYVDGPTDGPATGIHFYDANNPDDVPYFGSDSISVTSTPLVKTEEEYKQLVSQHWVLQELENPQYTHPAVLKYTPLSLEDWFKRLDSLGFVLTVVNSQ